MKNFTKIIILLVFIAIVSGCNKKGIVTPQPQPHTGPVFSISPASGINYTAVTITGKGFDTAKANNVVLFNGVAGVVNYASATRIIATVPATATTGMVTVTTNGKTDTIPNGFKVLQLVQTGNIPQPNSEYLSLIFDKNNDIYGIQAEKILVKYANGMLSGQQSIIYSAPRDTTFPNPNEPNCCTGPLGGVTPQSWLKTYTYTLNASMADANGDIYISQTTDKDSTTNLPPGESLTSLILKITPAGNVTVFAQNVQGKITAMAMDISGDLYYAYYPAGSGTSSYSIDKLAPGGTITSFASSFANTAQFIPAMAIDSLGNVYFANNNTATDNALTVVKFTPDGSGSTISGPIILPKDGFGSWMFFDASNNLIVGSSAMVLVINSANYTGIYLNPSYEYGLFADHSGNWYQLGESNVIKYTLQ
jgi:hypothetical protein